jgi:type IV secretion system protein VirB1
MVRPTFFCLFFGLGLMANSALAQNFNELSQRCAPEIHPNTLQAIVRVESNFNPYAIGVVNGALKRQPQSLNEAVAAAKMLDAQGKNFSMGLGQINKQHLKRFGLTYDTIFEPCKNLAAAQSVFGDCYVRANTTGNTQMALQKAFSCYYSGNFRFGFKSDFAGQPAYVTKVLLANKENSDAQKIRIPAITQTVPFSAEQRKVLPQATTKPKPTKRAEAVETVAVKEDPNPTPAANVEVKKSAAWDVFGEL